MSSGIFFNNQRYRDVEDAYQRLKIKDDYEFNEILMIKLLITKLCSYPELLYKISIKGGCYFLKDCIHQPTQRNSYWETGGQNGFIKCLVVAYKYIILTNVVLQDKLSEVVAKYYEYLGINYKSVNVSSQNEVSLRILMSISDFIFDADPMLSNEVSDWIAKDPNPIVRSFALTHLGLDA